MYFGLVINTNSRLIVVDAGKRRQQQHTREFASSSAEMQQYERAGSFKETKINDRNVYMLMLQPDWLILLSDMKAAGLKAMSTCHWHEASPSTQKAGMQTKHTIFGICLR